MSLTLDFIVVALGGELHGDRKLCIEAIAPLQDAGPTHISFLSHPRYLPQLQSSRAGCVIVRPEYCDMALAHRPAVLLTPDPYLYFARLTRLWKSSHQTTPPAGIHPSAVVDPSARIAPDAVIGPLCVIEGGVTIGAGSVLHSRVTVGRDCSLGQRCIVHSGAVIGADGFGFAPAQGRWEKIEQLGGVRIGDDVEIGANTCIDRGALGDTVIGDGVKLDNLVQIGHNVQVGAHTAMAGCAGVAGSARIGAGCTIGGGAVVLGHLRLADGVHVSAASVVTRSVLKPGHYTGLFPLDGNEAWEKNAASLKQLHRMRERVRAIENQLKNTPEST